MNFTKGFHLGAITRIDSPQLTSERKSRDFETSSPRSLTHRRTGSRDRKLSNSEDLSPAGFMSRYMIEDPDFAKGAYGKVSLAVDRISQDRVVLKKIPKTTPIRMIQNEIKAGALLGFHPNIATFHQYREFSDHHMMVFQYVDGIELFSYLEKCGFAPQPEADARAILSSIASALLYANSQSIAHRDIKLENILIDRNGHVSLIDFGLCTVIDGKKSREWCGSDNYIAPELIRRIAYDPIQADVFSLGVVAFALLFGCFPFENLQVNTRDTRFPQLRLRFPTDVPVSASAKDLISSMLEDNPDRRITFDEILQHPFILGSATPALLKISNE